MDFKRGLNLSYYLEKLPEIDVLRRFGRVTRIAGLSIESGGPAVKIGELCRVYSMEGDRSILAEAVGFSGQSIMLMPLAELSGIGPGSLVVAAGRDLSVPVSMELRGRILDGMGSPIDGGDLPRPQARYGYDRDPPDPLTRARISRVLPLGIRAVDGLLTCGKGQRLGIFAGSGVGKSTLLGMMARGAASDVNVIILIGERGREVRDFIEKDLGEEGLKKSVLVIATSDRPALIRVKAAMAGTAIAEYFRDCGMDVLLMMDSVTRFCMAQREVGMSVGEPPVSRGYTPSVFATLPRLLERSGNSDRGSITGLYTVLVEGDDLNEPVTDAVRGILDGHIVLSRELANRNHYPAIDVLASVSRVMPDIVDREHYAAAGRIKNLMAVYRDAQDLINIGAYRAGSSKEIDEAIKFMPKINDILKQRVDDSSPFDDTLQKIRAVATREAGG